MNKGFRRLLVSALRHFLQSDMERPSFQVHGSANLEQIAESLSVIAPVRIDSHPRIQGHSAHVVRGSSQDIKDPFLGEVQPGEFVFA